MSELDLTSIRAKRSRLGQRIGKNGQNMFVMNAVLFGLGAVYVLVSTNSVGKLAYLLLAPSFMFTVLALWYRYDLSAPRVNKVVKTLDDEMSPSLLGRLSHPVTPRSAWTTAMKTNEGAFLAYHLLISPDDIANLLSDCVHTNH